MPATLDPSSGLVAQAAAEIFDELGASLRTSTGRADLDVSTSSALGRIVWPFAERTADLQTLLAAGLYALDPEAAGGPLLSVVALLRGTRRLPASSSTCTLRVSGTAGTDMSGRTVRSQAGDVWTLAAGSVIPVAGYLDVTATAGETGPVSATLPGTWTILETVSGWTGVLGIASSLQLGEDEETDPDLRARLAAALSYALGTEPAIYARVAEVPGVTFLSVWPNRTDTPDAAGIPAHSVEVIAVGGTDAAVGEAILRTIPATSGFAGTFGTTSVDVVLSEDGLARPVRFTRPTETRIYAEVTLDTTGATVDLPAGIEDTIRAALVEWAATQVPRQTLTSAAAQAYLAPYVPAGSVSDIEVVLSTNGSSYTSYAFPGYRAYGRISDEPSPATVLGTTGEPFAISPGWTLDLKINGGLVASFPFAGSETTAADVVAVLAALSGATASDVDGSLQIETNLTGSTRSIQIMGTSSAGLLTVLGLSAGTTFGRDSDIAYYEI